MSELEGCTIEFDDAKRRATIRGPPAAIVYLMVNYDREDFLVDCYRSNTTLAVQYAPESSTYKQRVADRFFELMMRFPHRRVINTIE